MIHRKTALIVFALVALLPLVAFAEPDFGHKGRGPGGHGGRGHIFPPPGYLDLTAEQIDAVQALRETVGADLESAREEGRALHEQLRTALDSDSPDATAIGQLAIRLHAHRQGIRAVREHAESQFAALLTEEQLAKWENFKELRESRRGPRGRERLRERFGGGSGQD